MPLAPRAGRLDLARQTVFDEPGGDRAIVEDLLLAFGRVRQTLPDIFPQCFGVDAER